MEEWKILLIGVIVAAVAAVAAWWSARAANKSAEAACQSAEETRKTSLAQILMQITDAYGSEKMLEGMQKLRSWQNKHPKDWAKKIR